VDLLQRKATIREATVSFIFRLPKKNPGSCHLAESSLFWGRARSFISPRTIFGDLHRDGDSPQENIRTGNGGRRQKSISRRVSYFRLQNIPKPSISSGTTGVTTRVTLLSRAPATCWAGAWSTRGSMGKGGRFFEDMLLNYPGTKLSDPIFWGIIKAYLGGGRPEKAILPFNRGFFTYFLSSPHGSNRSLSISGQYYFDKKEFGQCGRNLPPVSQDIPGQRTSGRGLTSCLAESLLNQEGYPAAISAYHHVWRVERKAETRIPGFVEAGLCLLLCEEL